MSLEDRLMELEVRVAFQDDALAAMSGELLTQQRTVERLQAQMAMLVKRQEEMVARIDVAEGDEPPPPHY